MVLKNITRNFLAVQWLGLYTFLTAEGKGLIPGSGRSLREGNGKILHYPCLENPMNRGAWRAIVHEVTKSQTQLSD